jgi:hypothetical protein
MNGNGWNGVGRPEDEKKDRRKKETETHLFNTLCPSCLISANRCTCIEEGGK